MTKGLRFALVTTFYPPYNFGGDGQSVRRLAHALASRGHSIDVVHDVDAFRMQSSGPEPAALQEPEGVQVHPLRSPFGALSCLATHQLGRPVVHRGAIRRLLDSGFDVVHFHNVSLIGGPGILPMGSGIKLYTAHEHWLVCPTHVLWRHGRELCTGRECLRCQLRYRRPLQLWRETSRLEKNAANVDEFLTFSDFSAKKHAEFGFPRAMTVIPPFLPGRDPARGARRREEVATDPPYFLFVGRLEEIKGLQDVIPAFRGRGETELWVAGEGSFESQLRVMAGDSKRVRFLGHQQEEVLRRLYRGAVAVVMPSACFEVFPMVVLEAFREGVPIVARDLGPFPEIVRQSGGGLLFQSSRILGHALDRLASRPELRDRLGEAAATAFDALWSESIAIEAYLEVIRRVARKRDLPSVARRATSSLHPAVVGEERA